MARPRYQIPPVEIADVAWARTSPHLTALELFRVAAWKSAKGLAWLALNTEDEIRDRTTAAMETIAAWRGRHMVGVIDPNEWAAWRETARNAIGAEKAGTGLIGLCGVSYPMGTAVLALLDPNVWPVMDKWAVKTIFGPSAGRWDRAVAYEAFACHLACAGPPRWGGHLSIHELDQRAMRAAMDSEATPTEAFPVWWTLVVAARLFGSCEDGIDAS
jgi:hypothetical protein